MPAQAIRPEGSRSSCQPQLTSRDRPAIWHRAQSIKNHSLTENWLFYNMMWCSASQKWVHKNKCQQLTSNGFPSLFFSSFLYTFDMFRQRLTETQISQRAREVAPFHSTRFGWGGRWVVEGKRAPVGLDWRDWNSPTHQRLIIRQLLCAHCSALANTQTPVHCMYTMPACDKINPSTPISIWENRRKSCFCLTHIFYLATHDTLSFYQAGKLNKKCIALES